MTPSSASKAKTSQRAPQPNNTSHVYLEMHICKAAIQKKNIHEECIMSEEKPKAETLYETIPATYFLNTKPLPIISFWVARSPFKFFFVRFSLFFLKQVKFSPEEVSGMDDSLPSFHLLKDPLACKPRSEGPGEEGSVAGWSELPVGKLKPELGKPPGRPRRGQIHRSPKRGEKRREEVYVESQNTYCRKMSGYQIEEM